MTDQEKAQQWAIESLTKMVMSPLLRLKASEAFPIAKHMTVLTGRPWRVVSRFGVAQREYRVRPGDQPIAKSENIEGNRQAGGTI